MGQRIFKSRSGEIVLAFISIDKLTNEVVAMKAENVFIPDEIKGVQLTEQEKNDLKEGKAVFLEGMKSQAGNDFDAKVQISAERRGIEYIFENDRVFNRQELGGVKLTKQQVEDLNLGKAIFVEDMKRKDGELFSSFVKLDQQSGRPAYMRHNPDSPEGDREIYIPKEINGVKLTGEEREELRAGRVRFLKEMVNRKGEEFSSFIKADLETGRLSYSRMPDGFEQREQFKIPAECRAGHRPCRRRQHTQRGLLCRQQLHGDMGARAPRVARHAGRIRPRPHISRKPSHDSRPVPACGSPDPYRPGLGDGHRRRKTAQNHRRCVLEMRQHHRGDRCRA